ncbi:MAG: glycoside hydrolase family 43 protein [Treponema sp.]|nr:glycoside hydrolase family 43 protein [Treponema sp.]
MNKKIRFGVAAVVACSVLSGAFAAKNDVDKAVLTKYANANAFNGSQDIWGPLNCHDPKLFQDDDGTYYVYSTDAAIGGAGQKGLQIRTSKDLVHWTSLSKSAIQRKWDKDWLKWVNFNMAQASTWAPTVIKQNGLYYLIHGIITDSRSPGNPDAAIALTISSSPTGPFWPAAQAAAKDAKVGEILSKLGVTYKQSNIVRYTWYDRSWDDDDPSIAEQYCNNLANYDTHAAAEADTAGGWAYGFGGIDPEFVTDVATGKNVEYDIKGRKCLGLTYGSWKGGIALLYLDAVSLKPVNPADGKEIDAPADTVPGAFGIAIAGGYGAAYEGAQVIYNSNTGYYYCFVSMGSLDWDYRVGVGRSKEVTGPYFDGSGKSMYLDAMAASNYHEIGSKIIGGHELEKEFSFRCQGGQSILRANDGKVLFACHARTNFLPGYYFFLQVHQLFFTDDGWPVLNQNEYYEDKNFTEKLAALKASDIAGNYDAILTVRSAEMSDYKPFGQNEPVTVTTADGVPTASKQIALSADGTVTGAYTGTWQLAADGYTFSISLDGVGDFRGYALDAVDWARRKGKNRRTITFTAFDGEKTGEYFWGNKREK